MDLTRREFGALVGATAAAGAFPLTAQPRTASPVLDIADWGYYFYGVEHVMMARGSVVNGSQMYVEHWIPADVRHAYPVVLIHGGYGQGSD